jgi:uncharacterized delta-60 repeat protein/uncharacterized repeat protein (TIGR01451 family)
VLVDWYTTTKFDLTNSFYSPYGYYLPFYYPYTGLGYYYGIETIAQEYLQYFPTNGTLVFDDFQTSTNFVVPIQPSLYFYGYVLGYGLFTNNAISLIGLRLANPRPAPEENPELIKPTLGPTNQAAVAIVGVNGFSVIGTTTAGTYTYASGFAFERLTYRMNEYGHLYLDGISNSLAYGRSTNNNVIRIDVLLPEGGPATVHVEVWGAAVGYELMAGSDYADGVDQTFPDTHHTDGAPAAQNPADYQSYGFNLNFGNGRTAATFYVTNNNDTLTEFNEDILISLRPVPNNPPVNYLASEANITILYDDPPAGIADRDWNPAGDPRTMPPFNSTPGANGEVAVVLVQPDGRQIIAGAFTAYNTVVRNRLARINLDGSNDAGYDIGTGANEYIAAAALYPANTPNTNNVGKLIIAGNFTSYNGAGVARIARLNPDGTLDATFRPGDGADGVIRSVAIESDGKILIAGEFTRYNGEVRTRLARLNDDGSLDLMFDPGLGANATIWAMDVRDTPKTIFVPRSATGTEYEDVNAIDTGADQGTITIDYDFLVEPDTIRVYYQGVRLVDLLTNGVGQLVIPYGPGTNTVVTIIMNEGTGYQGTLWSYTVGITPVVRERSICIGGDFTTFNGVTRTGVARLRDNGSLDDMFDPKAGADNTIYALAVQADGKVLIGGAFTDIDFRSRNGIARLLRDGTLDTSYDPGTGFNDTVMSISLQRDNKALVGGYFTSFNQTRRVGLARLFQNGLLDTSFMDTAYSQFAGLIQPFSFSPQNKVNSIFPYSVTNTDLSFQTVTNNGTNLVITITNLSEVQYVMIGGTFTHVGGSQSFFVNDTNNYISTRQDRAVRYNVARLVGGITPGPGNLTFSFNQTIDEYAGQSTIKMQRLDGRLGTLQGLSFTSNRVALAGVDYGATSVTNTFDEYSYWRIWAPRSVGWVEPVYFDIPILENQIVQSDRIFDLMLMNPEASITLGGEWIPLGGARGVPSRQVTIIDDDVNRGVINFSSPAYTVNENAGEAVIMLLRTNGSVGTVSIDIFTRNDNARSGPNLPGYDYQGIYQTIAFGDAETNKQVRIRIWNDNDVESDERIGLVLTNATGATLPGGLSTATETATLTIIDDDFLPGRFNFSSAAYQTNEGAGFALITVTRTGGNVGSVSVQVAATDGAATSGLDFVALTNTLKWNSGESAAKVLIVPIKADLLVEGPETVNLQLFNASTNGAIGSRSTAVLTILDDNGYGTFNFSQPSYDANEDGGVISISVVRSGKTNGTVQVHYQVLDGSARKGVNYNATDDTLTFVDGEISKSFAIGLIHNPKPEGIKTVNLRLDQLTPAGAILGPVSSATLNILDKESLNVPAGSLDDEFSGAIGANNAIFALARQVDGNLLVGGDFTTYNHVSRIRLARLQPNGALDATFNAGGGPNRPVRAIALQDDGRVLVAGFFTSVNGVNRNHIARLTQDGTLDRSFDPGGGADKQIYAMVVLPDGRIVIGGSFATYNSVSRSGIAMVNTNGTLNLDFDPYPGVNGTVYAIALQPDGRLVIGGDFDIVQNVARSRIARLNPDGTLDMSFDPGAGANDAVRALVVQRDGKIVAGGSFTAFHGVARYSLARLNGDGSLDDAYLANEQGADNTVYALALQADEKMIVGGDFATFNGVNRHRLTRLNQDGRTDPSINFGSGADGFIAALLIQPDRKIVLAGGFTTFDGQPKAYVARVHGGSIAGSGALEFASAQYVVDEFSPYAAVTVIRRGGLTNQVSVWATTTDMTALNGSDYVGQTNYLVFPEGEVEQTFLVPILDDAEVEDPESVWLELRDIQGAAVGQQPWAELVIQSDDSRLSFQTKNFYVNEAAPSGFATITAVRTGATNSSVSVDYATLDGTASAGLDYAAATGSLLFNPGQTIKQFFVNITNDTLVEGNETVLLVLTNASANGQMGGYPAAALTIIDDEQAAGELSFVSPVFTVNEYETNIVITVLRTNGNTGYISVNYLTSDGSAQGGLDYRPVSGSLTFGDGETVKTFSVPIYQDFLDETNETVILTLANPSIGAVLGGTATATLTIQNTRLVNGNLNFAATNYTATEGSLAARMTVTRAFGSQGAIAVNYRTVDGTALAGTDYVPVANGVLFWPAGDTSAKTFTVTLVNDTVVEDTEAFGVVLFNPTGGATLGGVTTTTVSILDEDTGPGFLGFGAPAYYVDEGATNAYITVQRTFGKTGMNTIQYRTGAGGTARASIDYVPTEGTLTFLDGETSKSFAVRILERPGVEDLKTVPLELYGPVNPAYTNGQTIAATLTIVENEPQAGSVDLGYNAQANNQVYALALQTNVSKLYVGGDFTLLNGLARLRVGRINLNGSLDTTFDATTNFYKSVRVLALQSATNLLVGGVFTNVAGAGKSYLVRLKADGVLDTNFLADVDNSVQALALQTDGKILVGGAFTRVNGQTRNFLARLNADGSLDVNFKTNAAADAMVRAIVCQNDGGILVAGDFGLINGVERNHIARLRPTGELDSTFDPGSGPDDTVQCLALQPNGAVLLGGRFATVNGAGRGRVARLTSLGALDGLFDPGDGANEWIAAIAVEPNGKVYVAGGFTVFDGAPLNRLARLNADGSLDPTINFGAGANNFINALVLQPDRKIIIGGGFTEFDGVPRQYLARLNSSENAGLGSFVFGATNFGTIESQPKATVTVRRLAGTAGTVAVDYFTFDGTAKAGIHYTPASGTLIFGPSETIQTFDIPLVDDQTPNVDRTVGLALTNVVGGATLGLNRIATLTITNDDAVVGFANSFSVSENAGNATIVVQRLGSSVGPVTVDYFTSDGSATNGIDYLGVSGTLLFADGQTVATFVVPIFDDPIPEPNKTVSLFLTNATGTATLGLAAATLSIIDDDFSAGMLSFAQTVFYTTEQTNYAAVYVQRSAGGSGSASVHYSTSDGPNARAGIDYLPVSGQLGFSDNETLKAFLVPIINDEVVGGPKTINLTLSAPVLGGQLGISAATLIIQPDEAILDFASTNFVVAEDGLNALITVTRAGGGTNVVSVDYYTRAGTATNGFNYTNVTGRLTFGPGTASQSFLVPLIDNNLGQDNMYFFVVLTNAQGEAVLGANSTATVTILDDDVSFVFEPVNYIVPESIGAAQVIIVRQGRTNGVAAVDFATGDGTAVAGKDYVFTAIRLAFADGELSQTVSIPIIDDNDAEGNEFLFLYLNNPSSGATLATGSTGTLIIVDNEDALQFESADYFVDEGATNITLYVVRAGMPSGPLTVDYTTGNGTATADIDYTLVSGRLTFSPYEFMKAITVPILEDTLAEGDETFTVRLFNLSPGASLINPSNATVTIVDNDVAFHFDAPAYTVAEDGTNALIRVVRQGGTSNLVSVTLVSSGGTASAGQDYVAVSNVVVFPPGVTTQTVPVPILDDLLIEGNETVLLQLLYPWPAGVAVLGSPAQATLAIADNDACIVVPSGVSIESESPAGKVNGRIDPGETISAWFGLRNIGNVDGLNVTATLLATNGITPLNNPTAAYPVLTAGGITRSMRFTFQATGTNGGRIAATFQVSNGATSLGLVSFPFILGEAAPQFTNAASIIINDRSPATPYPSTVAISGVSGMVSHVTVTLRNLTHTYPQDIGILLVGPTGEMARLMGDVCSNAIANLTLTFDSLASTPLPVTGDVVSGTYTPTVKDMLTSYYPPAPAGPYGSSLKVFNGKNPNGTWSLYVVDDDYQDVGNIAGGWSLNISTIDSGTASADLALTMDRQPATATPDRVLTYYLSVTNGGPNVATNVMVTNMLPAKVTFLGCTSGQPTTVSNQVVTSSVGNLSAGAGATIVLQVRVGANLAPGEVLFDSATATCGTVELNLANNTAALKTFGAAKPALAASLKGSAVLLVWPTSDLPCHLEACDGLELGNWTRVSSPAPVISGSQTTVTISAPSAPRRFYRLAEGP